MLKTRISTALLSTVIFSLILAYIMYTPVSERYPNTWYESFTAPIPILLLITGGAYLIGGMPATSIIDKYVKKEILKIPLYLIAGFIIGVITIVVSFGTIDPEVISFGLYGVVGSLIFYLLMRICNWIKNRSGLLKMK